MTFNPAAESRVDFLEKRLLERDVTLDEVREYTWLSFQPKMEGQLLHDLNTFITQEDLAAFWWLHDWWRPDGGYPSRPALPSPKIAQFLYSANYSIGTPPVTFNRAMEIFYNKCVAYCKANDLNVVTPGLSKAERKREANKERMAHARAHRRLQTKQIPDEHLARVRELEDQLDTVKQQAADEDAVRKAKVVELQQAMTTASTERREAAAGWKGQIDHILAEIKTLTQK